jgi:hypothetical protein
MSLTDCFYCFYLLTDKSNDLEPFPSSLLPIDFIAFPFNGPSAKILDLSLIEYFFFFHRTYALTNSIFCFNDKYHRVIKFLLTTKSVKIEQK